MFITGRRKFVLCSICSLTAMLSGPALAADLNAEMVLRSIERGQTHLRMQQFPDGSWHSEVQKDHVIGITSLAVLALINSGMTSRDTPVKKGLEFLRRVPSGEPRQTYDAALMIMAFVAAKDPSRTDLARIARLAAWLEDTQTKNGNNLGGWSYGDVGLGGGDPSNAQFAVLGLREAAEAGIPVKPDVWERARAYWEGIQSPDGGWGYGRGNSTGSMTVAGISSLAIIQQMLRDDSGVAADGTPPCCQPEDPYPALERGIRWLGDHFQSGHNPNNNGWLLYYLYGVERAGRLSGRRFFGESDWYRQGASFLLVNQLPRSGAWRGVGQFEAGEGDKSVVGTSLALLFLSKGLAPVMMSKMKHGPRDPARPVEVVGQDWNTHPRDVRNLMEHISGLPRWPTLLTSQEVDVLKASKDGGGGVDALLQAPILFLTGAQALSLDPKEVALLKEYMAQGGFLFACPTCRAPEFEDSFRQLLTQILPPGDQELKLLPEDHPIYRSEYLLKADAVQLQGCEVGCRTAVIYSREDLGCLWSYWQRHSPAKRNPQLVARVERGMQIAINVCAYATGREPPKSLDAPRKQGDQEQLDEIQRGLLQVAQLKHTGQWDAAPHALRRLLFALNETVGVAATTKPGELLPTDPSLFQYRLLYMHGRTRFSFGPEEREAIKLHLSRGGMLFADACCGAKPFDKSFRELVTQLYPDAPLKTIDLKHEIFTEEIGHELKKVRRRTAEGTGPNVPLSASIKDVDPVLEGVEVDGRLVIVYSKYDLSCALERQAALSCEGYVSEDATKLATNIVLYSLKKEPRLPAAVK